MSYAFDITVTQRGDTYIVSGPGTEALYAKMQTIPPEARNLLISALENGIFTLQKMGSQVAG